MLLAWQVQLHVHIPNPIHANAPHTRLRTWAMWGKQSWPVMAACTRGSGCSGQPASSVAGCMSARACSSWRATPATCGEDMHSGWAHIVHIKTY